MNAIASTSASDNMSPRPLIQDGSDFANQALIAPPGQNVIQTTNQILGLTIFFGCLALLAVILRLAARRVAKVEFGLDDWTVLILGLLTMANMISNTCLIQGAAREEQGDRDPALLIGTFQSIYISQILYVLSVTFTKFAALSFYLRLFTVNTTFRQAVYVFAGLTFAWGFASLWATIVQCLPVAGFWDPTVQADCIDLTAYLLGTNIVDVVLDICILFLPLPVIWRLQALSRSKKVGILLIFLLGSLDCTMALARLIVLMTVGEQGDHSIDYKDPAFWSNLEINIGTICVCLPVVIPVYSKLIRRYRDSRYHNMSHRCKGEPDTIRLCNPQRTVDSVFRNVCAS